MTDYVLVGGGAFAREIHDWFGPVLADRGDRFGGYIDDNDQPMRPFGRDLPQLGNTQDYQPDPARPLVMGVATPKGKAALAERLTGKGGAFASLIHPTNAISASARLGRGAIVSPYCVVSADSRAGDFVTIISFASLGHDVAVDDYVTLSGYAGLTGAVKVGARTFFGAGARVLPRVRIGADCTIGAGAIVVRNAPDGATLYAAPAEAAVTPLEEDLARRWWHLVAHRSELTEPGDYVRLDWPLGDLLLYNDEGEVIATDNVCPHRGTRFFDGPAGCGPMLCPYHGWRYRGGALRVARRADFDPADIEGLDVNRRRTAWCGDWLFAGVEPAQSLEAQLGVFGPFLAAIGADVAGRRDFNVYPFECDWRVAVENALEAYHVPMVHAESLGQLALAQGRFEFDGANSLWRTEVTNAGMARRLSGLQRLFATPNANAGYVNLHVFPFAMISSTYGYSYSLQVFAPARQAGHTHFSSRLYAGRPAPGKAAALEGFFASAAQLNRQVFEEDHAICKRVSPNYDLAAANRVFAASEERLRWFQGALREGS